MRKRMSLLFQNGALLTDLSVFENVAFPLREHTKLPEAAIRDIVLMKLEAVGLRGARDLYQEELCGGRSRSVAVGRSEDGRGGQGCALRVRSWWSLYQYKKPTKSTK